MTHIELRDLAHRVALAISEDGEAARLGVVACDDGSAIVTTRAGLVDAVREIVTRLGLDPASDPLDTFVAQIEAVPAWQVPVVLWHEDELRVASFVPSRGSA